jgi:NADH-quinone oxidoreductase subunit A
MKETTFSVLTFSEYLPIFVFLLFALLLSVIILGASYLLAYQGGDTEKLTAYECGFDPFDDARNQFDVRFYLVAILFIIFDLEASFLFPWAVSLGKIGAMGFWTMFDFLFELCVGFIYAWKIGALEWQL